MIEIPSLWSHQEKQVADVRSALGEHDAVILNAPAGCGKTRISKHVIARSLNRDIDDRSSGRILFSVYGRNLVDNACDSFNEEPSLPHGVIMSGAETDWKKKVSIGSINTLNSWYVKDDKYQVDMTFDLIFFDESHVSLPQFAKFLKAHNAKRDELGLRQTKAIGLTATPAHPMQSDVFGTIVKGPTTEWLIEQGKLSRFEYFGGSPGNMGMLIKQGDKYTEDSVSRAMEGLTGDLVRDWQRLGQGRPTVGFFPRLAHAMEAKELFQSHGVNAQYVDGQTSDDERRQLFRDLGNGSIDYLCNVGVVERGTNIPQISCIQLATVVRQRSRLEQMLGRGSRTADGKDCVRIIDHGFNVHGKPDSLGFFEDEYEWTLDASNSKDAPEGEAKPTVKCPRCDRIYRGGKCSACGYEPTPKELKPQGLEFVEGEMVRLDRDKLKKKNEPSKKSMEKIMVDSLYRAGKNGTWGSVYAIACKAAEKQGDKFRPPASFDVAGKTYKPVKYGSADSKRKVKDVYDFLGRKYN